MTRIFIRNHDLHKYVCEYSQETGMCRELLREEMEAQNEQVTRGFYVRNEDLLIGVFASKEGPIFFCNESTFMLREPDWNMEVIQEQDDKLFRFHWAGEEVLSVVYKEPFGVGTHFGADDEFVDFYTWIAKRKQSDRFVPYFTTT